MTDLPPLLFVDLPVVKSRTPATTRTVSVRIDHITTVGDPIDSDYTDDDTPDDLPARSRVVVGDARYLAALSRTDVLDLIRHARTAVMTRGGALGPAGAHAGRIPQGSW